MEEATAPAPEPDYPRGQVVSPGSGALIVDIEGNGWRTPKASEFYDPGPDPEVRIIGAESMVDATLFQPQQYVLPADAAGKRRGIPALTEEPLPDAYEPESDEEARRAEAARRLGGGPIVRDEQRRQQAVSEDVKVFLDGMRSRPVL
jgi:hypothetical protein